MVGHIVDVVIGGVITGVITWYATRWHYEKASRELMQESAALRSKVDIVLRALEQASIVDLARNEAGEITGITIKLAGSISGALSMSGDLTVIPPQGS